MMLAKHIAARRAGMSSKRTVGFTLIEMMLSLAILALLATMAAPVGALVYKRNKEQELKLALRQMREGIDAYKTAYDSGHVIKKVGASGYPPTLEVLEQGVEDAQSADRKKIYFIRKIPRDPFAEPGGRAADTWGLRSYASEPDLPQRGEDVFDVYSKSTEQGLNGVPYREW